MRLFICHNNTTMLNILLTGVATLDIINQVQDYPSEDSEVRAQAQQLRLGGNAANSAIVMQQLGVHSYLMANRADDSTAGFIFEQLEARGINSQFCPIQKNSVTPTSYITLSQSTGSRSIVHYRLLDELSSSHFIRLPLVDFSWLHFEARDCQNLHLMLKHASQFTAPISLELEKPRDHIDKVVPFAHLLLISRPFAEAQGFHSATACIEHYSQRYADKIISCTWGSDGAWVYHNNHILHQAAFTASPIVESLGAGDTYNAAFISALAKRQPIEQALQLACQLAAKKCTQTGFDNLTLQT